jgi:hypothetical protein
MIGRSINSAGGSALDRKPGAATATASVPVDRSATAMAWRRLPAALISLFPHGFQRPRGVDRCLHDCDDKEGDQKDPTKDVPVRKHVTR